jgi:hypothetical protein
MELFYGAPVRAYETEATQPALYWLAAASDMTV